MNFNNMTLWEIIIVVVLSVAVTGVCLVCFLWERASEKRVNRVKRNHLDIPKGADME